LTQIYRVGYNNNIYILCVYIYIYTHTYIRELGVCVCARCVDGENVVTMILLCMRVTCVREPRKKSVWRTMLEPDGSIRKDDYERVVRDTYSEIQYTYTIINDRLLGV